MIFTDRTKTVLEFARRRSIQGARQNPSSIDVLYGLLYEGTGVAANCLHRAGISMARLDGIAGAARDLVSTASALITGRMPPEDLDALLLRAQTEASRRPKPSGLSVWPVIGTEHLLLAILCFHDETYDTLRDLLATSSATPESLYWDVQKLLGLPVPDEREVNGEP